MNPTENTIQILGTEIKNKLSSERIFEKIQWSLSILFLIITPAWILLLFTELIISINLDNNIIVLILFSLFCFTFIILGLLRKYAIEGIDSIIDNNSKISTIDTHALNMEDTLLGFHLINKSISTIILWKRAIHWALFYREKGGKMIGIQIDKFLKIEFEYILDLLSNIKSDLLKHIEDKQKILESAKDTIENNIQGPIELEQVSELQKTRLDRQIEQFEELQKVLIKA